MKPRKDITGQRFGRLVALRFTELSRTAGFKWLCRCDCGKECEVRGPNLRSGHTQSCGCLHQINSFRTHGMRHTNTYRSWAGMITRCSNPRSHSYRRYGGRGITVCPTWAASFEAFLADMGKCPPGHTIERIDNDKGYSPSNCRWATKAEQARNRRSNHFITFQGQRWTLLEWSRLTGIPHTTLLNRIKRGWTGAHLFFKGDGRIEQYKDQGVKL